jgi:predicted porin
MTPFRLTALSFTAAMLFASVGAQAQSTVNISGLVDLGVYRGFDKTKNVGTIQRSNIAFSGTEDLGGGLAATFKLSHRFDADTGQPEGVGAKPFWQGESTVGLKGGFGSLRLGRALDVVSNNDWAYDPWYNFNRIASPAWQYWHYNYASSRTSNNGKAEYGRLANGVFYDSPSFGGFAVHYSGSFEKAAGQSNNNGIALTYGGGVEERQ